MGKITRPQKVKLVTAICFQNIEQKDTVLARIIEKCGEVEETSQLVDFRYTSYYEDEMGAGLKKIYFSFKPLLDPAVLPDIKIFTNSIEDASRKNDKRLFNIDPGYIELAKLVLATTKNFSHRIYIGKGIYGDVQLYWQGGAFKTNPWTYPDYQNPAIKAFFEKIRTQYFKQIKGN